MKGQYKIYTIRSVSLDIDDELTFTEQLIWLSDSYLIMTMVLLLDSASLYVRLTRGWSEKYMMGICLESFQLIVRYDFELFDSVSA